MPSVSVKEGEKEENEVILVFLGLFKCETRYRLTGDDADVVDDVSRDDHQLTSHSSDCQGWSC